MNRHKKFFQYVLPSVFAFALSGVYAIVDGFFVGNSIGDIGLSTINIAYPVVSLIQAIGTGIGMGGAVHYSISKATGDDEKASSFVGGTMALLLGTSVFFTIVLYAGTVPLLKLLGARGDILTLGAEYLHMIILGAVLQVFATGIVPLIRNCGGAAFAMVSMVMGFLTNIVGDYLLVWVLNLGMFGAAFATVVGQGVTMLLGFGYLLYHKLPIFHFPFSRIKQILSGIIRSGFAPFGLTISPLLSLILINRFSIVNGGETAVACYACIAYVTTIVYMLMQGVGDGSQPLMSSYYGENARKQLRSTRLLAYVTAEGFALISMLALFLGRYEVGTLFGASGTVKGDVAHALPIFLLGFLFLAFTRITTASFYATEQNLFSYILVYAEPVFLLLLLLVVPRLGGQQGIWWSMCLAQIFTSAVALLLKFQADRRYRLL